jgi:hypothetical protein
MSMFVTAIKDWISPAKIAMSMNGRAKMRGAIRIIAICEVIRAAMAALQIATLRKEKGMRENAYQEFVASLKQSDKQFVRDLLNEFEREEADEDQ